MSILDNYVDGINKAPNLITGDFIIKILEKITKNKEMSSTYKTQWSKQDEISDRVEGMIREANKEVLILMDNPLPDFFKKNNVYQSLYDGEKYPDIQILGRMEEYEKYVCPELLKLKKEYRGNLKISTINKETIKTPSLKYDTFVVVDRLNIFWGKPGFDEAKFLQGASFLAKQMYTTIDDLIEKCSESPEYQ